MSVVRQQSMGKRRNSIIKINSYQSISNYISSDHVVQIIIDIMILGREIDVLAREPLWRGGLDYNHGTGHGIGHFLNVHERKDHFLTLHVFNP